MKPHTLAGRAQAVLAALPSQAAVEAALSAITPGCHTCIHGVWVERVEVEDSAFGWIVEGVGQRTDLRWSAEILIDHALVRELKIAGVS